MLCFLLVHCNKLGRFEFTNLTWHFSLDPLLLERSRIRILSFGVLHLRHHQSSNEVRHLGSSINDVTQLLSSSILFVMLIQVTLVIFILEFSCLRLVKMYPNSTVFWLSFPHLFAVFYQIRLKVQLTVVY